MGIYSYIFYSIFLVYKRLGKSDPYIYIFAFGFFSFCILLNFYWVSELIFWKLQIPLFYFDNYIYTLIIGLLILILNYFILLKNGDHEEKLLDFEKSFNARRFVLVLLYVALNFGIAAYLLVIQNEKAIREKEKTGFIIGKESIIIIAEIQER